MKTSIYAMLTATLLALPALAQDAGDAANGEKEFKKCKACHMIQAPDGTDVVKGGKTGPNLFGVIGRAAGSEAGFNYGEGLKELGGTGLVWDEATLATYVTDPTAFLKEKTGDAAAKSNMTFKLAKGGEDIAAFLATKK